MAIDKKLLGTFLKDNGFPKAYTADRVREDVRNGKLKPSDLALFLYNANDDLFDTPVVGPEVFRSDDGGRPGAKHILDFWMTSITATAIILVWYTYPPPIKITFTSMEYRY